MKIADMTLDELIQTLKGTFVQCDDCDKRHEQNTKEHSELKALETENKDKLNDIFKAVKWLPKLITMLFGIIAAVYTFVEWWVQHVEL